MATGKGSRKRKWVKKLGKALLRRVRVFLQRQSLVGGGPVLDVADFPWVVEFESNWREVRRELQAVLQDRQQLPAFHQLSPDQKRISQGDNWKTFVFSVFGHRVEENCERCPQTCALLSRLPTLENAWFSILAPGYHIPPHRGPTAGIIRFHLPLIVPGDRQNCYIRVDDQILHWEEGCMIVFDDTYEHEVYNNTGEERVVLFFDIDRPMRWPGRWLNQLLLLALRRSAYVRDPKRNLAAWGARK